MVVTVNEKTSITCVSLPFYDPKNPKQNTKEARVLKHVSVHDVIHLLNRGCACRRRSLYSRSFRA